MEELKRTPEEKLMIAIFGENVTLYPYIVVTGEGDEKKEVKLTDVIQEVLETLPLMKGKTDSDYWNRGKKALELRFGLIDGINRTLEKVGQDQSLGGIDRERARQILEKTFRILRHPVRSRRLKEFIIPSPEEIGQLREEMRQLREKISLLEESNRSLVSENQKILRTLDLYGPNAAKIIEMEKKGGESIEILISRYPNNRVWNAVRRAEIGRIPELKLLVESGRIKSFRNVGDKTVEFLKEVLSKEAPA